MNDALLYVLLSACLISLLRISFYLVSSDVYAIRQLGRHKKTKRAHLPYISILIPAHNEEKSIERLLVSLHKNNYPMGKYEAIVVNDGSTDRTREIVEHYKHEHRQCCKIRLINRKNAGKAKALNYAMKRCARGNLIMCLDADSYLEENSLRNAAQHFRDRNVVAAASNVNIIEDGTLLALAQRIEYLMGYHMKKGQSQLGIDYIIGGVGAIFRRSILKSVAFFDSNTMTEDIDLTVKIIINKAKKQRITYAADSIAYTEAVHSLRALFVQRFRWKYGRNQVFLKNIHFFFTRDSRHAKRMSWFMLPFVILQDFIFMLEPIFVGFFIYAALHQGGVGIFRTAVIFFSIYVFFNIWSSTHLSVKERLRLSYYGPPMYVLIYLTAIADYYALIKALLLLPRLKGSLKQRHFIWRSPERKSSVLPA